MRSDNGSHTIRWQTTSAHLARNAARISVGRRPDLLIYAYFTVGLPGIAQLALLLFLVAAAGAALS